MSDARREAARASELQRAAESLTTLAEQARSHARSLAGPAGSIRPLHAQADALIAGTATGAHRQLRSAIDAALSRMTVAQAALDHAAQRAAAAAAEAQRQARAAQSRSR